MVRLLIAMLGAVVPLLADAECTVDPPKTLLTLTPEHMAVRNALFLRLCTSAGPELVDVTDPALVGRIVFPHGLEPSENLYPRALKTPVLVAFLVDTDGTV